MARILAFLVMLLTAPGMAIGGGPLAVTTDGVPVGWDTANPVPYHTDQGGLGSLSNTDAVALVETLFARWADVPTATIAFNRAGTTIIQVTHSEAVAAYSRRVIRMRDGRVQSEGLTDRL